jgi:hypothetical protein
LREGFLTPAPVSQITAKVTAIEQFYNSGIRILAGMSSAQFMTFRHNLNSTNKDLVESHCEGCGSWIAAGPQEQYLKIAESAHHCPVE